MAMNSTDPLTIFEIEEPTLDLALREAWRRAKDWIEIRSRVDDRATTSGRLILVSAEVTVSPFSRYADDYEPTFKFELRKG